jgi:hypothetical protein
MGQSKSKERDFKEQKRSKVLQKDFRSKDLKNREEKRSKRRVIREKKQRGCCVSPSEHPAYLTPTLCMSVFYHLSFLHLQLPPVRFSSNGAQENSLQYITKQMTEFILGSEPQT